MQYIYRINGTKATELTVLISAAKNRIREQYQDAEQSITD